MPFLLVYLAVGAFSHPPRVIIHLATFNAGTALRLHDSGGQEGGTYMQDALLWTASPRGREACCQLVTCMLLQRHNNRRGLLRM